MAERSPAVAKDRRKPSAALPSAAGRPLADADRASFESAYGADLSGVRVHADDGSASSAAGEGANAYTAGGDIVFGAGRYSPSTWEGRLLLAHELGHVMQQRRRQATGASSDEAAAEADADRAARAAASGQPAAVADSASVTIARQPAEEPGPGAGADKNKDIENMQDEDLDAAYESVRAWLLDPTNQADPHAAEARAYLARLEHVIDARNPQRAGRARRQQVEAKAVGVLSSVGGLLPAGPHPEILPFLTELVAGMGERVEQLPSERTGQLQARWRKLSFLESLRLQWGFVKGFGIGIWEEIKGIVDLVLLPFKAIHWLWANGPAFFANWKEESGGLEGLKASLGAAAQKASEEIATALKNPAEAWRQLEGFFQALVQSGLQKANQLGRQATDQIVSFFERPTEEVGEGIGKVVGHVLFNVVLLVATDAIGNLVKEGGSLIAKLLSKIPRVGEALAAMGEFLPKAIAAFKALRARAGTFFAETLAKIEEIFTHLGELIRRLKPRPVAEAVGPGGIRVAVDIEEEAGAGSRALMSSTEGKPPRTTQTAVDELYGRPPEKPPSAASAASEKEAGKGFDFELKGKRAERVRKVSEALKDDTKWGNLTANDRFRLGRVYDELVEGLSRTILGSPRRVEHYIDVNAKLIAELRAEGGRVLITEGRLAGGKHRFDLLGIDFDKGTAELLDLASRPEPRHIEKLLTYKRLLSKLLGIEIEAKEIYYTGENGELLEPLVEVVVE